jgi:hypothetical protein
MTHDDPDKEALFLQYIPSMICMHLFLLMIVLGYLKWMWKMHVYHLQKLLHRKTNAADFIYEFEKSADCCGGSGLLGCQHDETISNKAGQLFIAKGFNAPYWAILVKKVTHRWEPNHVELSVEPLRKKGKI